MRIDAIDGDVTIAFDGSDEAADFLHDLEDALAAPGTNITSHLVNADGVSAFVIRVNS